MKRVITISTMIGLFLLFVCLKTGRGEENVITLAEAIDLALKKNPTLKAVEHMVEAASARVGQARSGFLPSLDFYERYSRTNNPVYSFSNKLNQEVFSSQDFQLDVLNDPAPVSNFNSQFVLNQPIFDQGKTFVEVKQATLMKDVAEKGMERVRQEIIFEVIKAYSRLVMAKEDLKLAQETERMANAHVKLAQDLFQTGQVVKSDLLSAQVRLSEGKEMVIQAQNGLRIARAALNKVVGIDQRQDVEVEKTLSYGQGKLVLNDLVTEALQKRPDLLAMDDQVKNSEEGIKMAKTGFLPSFNLMAQYDLNDEDDVWKASGESWTIWGIFQVNLFDGLHTTYKVREAKEEARRFSNQRQALMDQIELEVREAFHHLEEAEARVTVASEAIIHAEESLRIVEDRYQVGLSPMVEVLDNEVALTKTRRNYLKAIHDRHVARVGVELAKGTLSGVSQ